MVLYRYDCQLSTCIVQRRKNGKLLDMLNHGDRGSHSLGRALGNRDGRTGMGDES